MTIKNKVFAMTTMMVSTLLAGTDGRKRHRFIVMPADSPRTNIEYYKLLENLAKKRKDTETV